MDDKDFLLRWGPLHPYEDAPYSNDVPRIAICSPSLNKKRVTYSSLLKFEGGVSFEGSEQATLTKEGHPMMRATKSRKSHCFKYLHTIE